MEKTKFELDSEEAALIFKKDMSIEIILPKIEDEETVDFEENQNVFVALAVAASSDTPEFRQIIGAKLEEMLGGAEEPTENPCAEVDGPGFSPQDTVDAVIEEATIVPNCTCGAEDDKCEEC